MGELRWNHDARKKSCEGAPNLRGKCKWLHMATYGELIEEYMYLASKAGSSHILANRACHRLLGQVPSHPSKRSIKDECPTTCTSD